MVPPIFVSAADELKNKTVCEDQELKLHCHESKFLNIYSATYGRRTQQRDVCASQAERLPPFGMCLSTATVRALSERGPGSPGEGSTQLSVPGRDGESQAGRKHPPRWACFCPLSPAHLLFNHSTRSHG